MKTTFNYLQGIALLSLMAFLSDCGSDSEDPTIDCSSSNLSISIASTTDESCASGGSVTILSTGGTGTIQYSIDGTTFQSSTTFDDLDAGNYTITAKDTNACTSTVSVTISGDSGNIAFTTATVDSGCGTSQGSITVTASGGDSNYQYSLDGGAFGTSNVFSDLSKGAYLVAVQDGASCEQSRMVEVLSGTSFSTHIQPIITQSCATTNCHVPGTGRADFTQFSVIQSNASGIKSRTQSGNMPAVGSLTQQQIDLIACWVDDGALNN